MIYGTDSCHLSMRSTSIFRICISENNTNTNTNIIWKYSYSFKYSGAHTHTKPHSQRHKHTCTFDKPHSNSSTRGAHITRSCDRDRTCTTVVNRTPEEPTGLPTRDIRQHPCRHCERKRHTLTRQHMRCHRRRMEYVKRHQRSTPYER
jgi:hypothetical protein